MAPEAYVLIDTEIGKQKDFVKKVRKIEGVDSAHRVYGVYDIVAHVKASTEEEMKSIIVDKIRKLDYFVSTLTMIKKEV